MTFTRAPRPTPRGFTFTEVMVVMVLAGVVTLGLVTFYLNSQIMWTGASTQVMAQRDATSMLELMRRYAQNASSADVDSTSQRVIFFDPGLNETHRFFWSPADSFVHYGEAGNLDQGPVTPTTVEIFHVSYDQTLGLLSVDTLRVRSTAGQQVTMSTAIGLYNR